MLVSLKSESSLLKLLMPQPLLQTQEQLLMPQPLFLLLLFLFQQLLGMLINPFGHLRSHDEHWGDDLIPSKLCLFSPWLFCFCIPICFISLYSCIFDHRGFSFTSFPLRSRSRHTVKVECFRLVLLWFLSLSTNNF